MSPLAWIFSGLILVLTFRTAGDIKVKAIVQEAGANGEIMHSH